MWLGDVHSHDLAAAAIMAQLRAVLHGLAADGQPPAEMLARADQFLAGIDAQRFATMVVADIAPATGLATVSIAGHLPPLLLTAGGDEVLDLRPDLPLGMLDQYRGEHVLTLPPRGRLVLLTDGLVERRDAVITDCLAELLVHLRSATPADERPDPQDPSAVAQAMDELIEGLMHKTSGLSGDDAAILIADIALATGPGWPPRRIERTLPPITRAAYSVRRWAEAGLSRHGIDDGALADVLTVLTELTANGARASAGPITVSVEHRGTHIRAGVRDDTHRRPRVRTAAPDDQDGRGLAIVGGLADAWGIEEHPDGGKTVWADVRVAGA